MHVGFSLSYKYQSGSEVALRRGRVADCFRVCDSRLPPLDVAEGWVPLCLMLNIWSAKTEGDDAAWRLKKDQDWVGVSQWCYTQTDAWFHVLAYALRSFICVGHRNKMFRGGTSRHSWKRNDKPLPKRQHHHAQNDSAALFRTEKAWIYWL